MLPDAKRRAALDLQVRKSFPFKDPAYAAFWKGADASVYAWDETLVQAAQDEAGIARNTQVVPETLIRARGTNGLRLVTALEGFEGQHWIDGFLKTSRWWPTIPSGLEWSNFIRSLGINLTSADTTPTPLDLPFLDRPWTESTFSLDDWASILQSRRGMAIAATLAVCPFVFLGGTIAVVSVAESRTRGEIATLDKANQTIRKDRADAYTNLTAIEDFMRLNEYPAQAEVLATAVSLLGSIGSSRIVSWSFDRGNLELIARSEIALDPTAYITLFERDPLFETVSGTFVGPERDLQLRMIVSKRVIN